MRSDIVLLILGMAAVTFLTRFSCLYLFRNITLPETVSRSFRYIPVGILTAMVVPGLFMPRGQLLIHWQNYYLFAGLASVLAATRWKSMFASLAAGMAVILLLNTLL